MTRRPIEHGRILTPLKPWDMKRANIGERYWQASLSKLPADLEYAQFIERWLADIREHIQAGRGLILCGPHGSGKTSLAVVVAKEVLSRGGTVLKVGAGDLVSLAIENPIFDADFRWMDRVREVDLLLLDDLGAEHPTEYSRSVLERVVRDRLETCRSMVISTNLTKDRLAEHVGKATVEAMSEFLFPLQVSGVDWREQARASMSAQMARYLRGDSK